MNKTYERDFENFLLHTNEKLLLFEKISEEIRKKKVSSLLDIGAGNGFLSVPLSKKVDYYLAIEKSKLFAEKLSRAGLNVIQRSFPFNLNEKFDMVLISHALPEDNYENFIREAWNFVLPGGSLLIITHKEKGGDWVRLLEEIKGLKSKEKKKKDYTYDEITLFMSKLGETKVSKTASHVYSSNEKDAIRALSFIFSDGDQKLKKSFMSHKTTLSKILSKYTTEDGIFFPVNHFFIITQKNNQ